MHVPDGFLTNPVCAATTAASIVGLASAAVMVRKHAAGQVGSLAAVVGAGIFAGQMVNFPVAQGTSGHLVGAALATALLGPWAAILVMAAVLAVQCALFGDGGAFALGANLLNMGLVAVGVSAGILAVGSRLKMPRWFALAFAAWCSTIAAAAACAMELAASGAQPLSVVLPAMLKVHALIGIGEALITVAVVALVKQLAHISRRTTLFGVASAIAIAVLLAPVASSSPDGLERVAESLGFATRAVASFAAPLADYVMPGIPSPALATAFAGAIGALLVFAVIYLPVRRLR
jgi:cobalt/nickel transport system permease protein